VDADLQLADQERVLRDRHSAISAIA
jgi:hypothetical protein